uniref:ribosomal protein L6 n=1 Tax=Chroothece richteriana TaxID=101928 RepID=UPI001FCD2466|nr:ribosomal protein L6 [Chroothece richteriana]UNJ14185.1 ribosomal protein L6 [Chroothece richteriana]
MSRIGKKSIVIPPKVEVKLQDHTVIVKGPKGELSQTLSPLIKVNIEDSLITVRKKEDSREAQELFGLSRTLVNNLVKGVSEGFTRKLEITGVGYRAQVEGKNLILNMGYSHAVHITPPADIAITVEKNTTVIISGMSKQTVGQVAANIRSVRPPEPYKGKGIKYSGEIIRRKVGKAGRGK